LLGRFEIGGGLAEGGGVAAEQFWVGKLLPQRGARTRPAAGPVPAARSAKTAEAMAKTTAPKRKLSFREKHSLETLPARIDGLHADIGALRQKLADPKLFGRDPAAFNQAAADLAASEQALAAAEEEWLTLELLRENLER